MPYVPSEKTDGKSQDRNLIDVDVEALAEFIAVSSKTGITALEHLHDTLRQACCVIRACEDGYGISIMHPAQYLGRTIYNVAKTYNYQGAWLGELNYAVTRLIQVLPQKLVNKGIMKSELRYWWYAEVVGYLGALTFHYQSISNTNWIDQGFAGVFEDIKDEYKWRVNRSYEAAQIIRSGDCYDTPFYTKLVEVVDHNGEHVGYTDIYLKRSEKTLNKDIVGKMIIIYE